MEQPLGRSPIPLYFRIANSLEAAISSGEYRPGMYLPSEKALAQSFGVSLITVRGAMGVLIDKGLVARRRGRGTVVLGSDQNAVWELGWLSNLITSVITSTLDIVAMGTAQAPSWVARRFGLPSGERVHFMRTVRRAVQRSNEPFMTTDLYHPREIGSRLRKSDFQSTESQSRLVVMTLEKRCGLTVSGVRQTMGAERADRDARELLGVRAGSPLLVVTRDYFSNDGRLVQTGRSRYRTENYEYVLNLARSPGRRAAEPARKGEASTRDA